MPKNQTNTQRAARTLMTLSDLTYAQALQLLRNAGTIPDLGDPSAVAALLATRKDHNTTTAPTFDVAAHLWDITIDDGTGHSYEHGQDHIELWPDMFTAITINPTSGMWSGATNDDGTWKVRISIPKVPDDNGPLAPAMPVVWADDDGEFLLAGGGFGNPGCDDCGQDDAVVRIDGRYLCVAGAYERGIGWECDECEHPIVSNDGVSDQHASSCSLYPDNVTDTNTAVCHFCHQPAGAGYHIAGVIAADDNPVVCDPCWDERLR